MAQFDPTEHKKQMARLAKSRSHADMSSYIFKLAHQMCLFRERSPSDYFPPRAEEAIEVGLMIEKWECLEHDARYRKAALIEAAYAALELMRYDLVESLYNSSLEIPGEACVAGHPNWRPGIDTTRLGPRSYLYLNQESPENSTITHLEQVLDGSAKVRLSSLRSELARAKEQGAQPPMLDDLEFSQIIGETVERLLYDPLSAQVWATTPLGRFVFFDGYQVREAPFRYDDQSVDDVAYVRHVTCDERQGLWQGKRRLHLIHRYGCALRWTPGYVAGDGSVHLRTRWITCNNEEQALMVQQTIERSFPEFVPQPPWHLSKSRGVVMYGYSKAWDYGMVVPEMVGVFGRFWLKGITKVEVFAEFQSVDEAQQRFSEREHSLLREGATLRAVVPRNRLKDGTALRMRDFK